MKVYVQNICRVIRDFIADKRFSNALQRNARAAKALDAVVKEMLNS